MPVIQNFTLSKGQDGTVTFYLVPAQPVGGWAIRYDISRRNDSASMFTASIVSGQTNGASGLTVLNSGQGWFRIALNTSGISGLLYGNYASKLWRTDSGSITTLAEGFCEVTP